MHVAKSLDKNLAHMQRLTVSSVLCTAHAFDQANAGSKHLEYLLEVL